MELARKVCRLCLSETDFNISINSKYCRKTKMTEKILVCLKIAIDESDKATICHQCANNVEKYYEFVISVKKAQVGNGNGEIDCSKSFEPSVNQVNGRVTSYVREQVFDADFTFSFLEMPEENGSTPFFSYFSPPNNKQTNEPWKTPRPAQDLKKERNMKPRKTKSRQLSRDIFESQSQEAEEPEPKSLDWTLTPDDNIIKRLKEKCFGRSNF